jgi:hypothetical protein
LDRLEKKLETKARFVRIDINTESGRKIRKDYEIEFVPAVLVFDEKGVELWRQTGVYPDSVSITKLINN